MTFESKFRNFVGRINDLSKEEIKEISKELLSLYNNEKKEIIDGWHGKSSFQIKEVGDKLIVTKYKKPEKGAEAKEVNYEIDLNELRNLEQRIILYLNYMKLDKKYITSRELAEDFYKLTWKEIFNNRKRHNKYTIMLNVLDKRNVIKYLGGRIYAIKKTM